VEVFAVYLVIIAPLCGMIAAIVQSNRGGSVIFGFLVGLLFGPFGIVASLISGGRPCPHCRSLIHPKATRCPKCQGNVPELPPRDWRQILITAVAVIGGLVLVAVSVLAVMWYRAS